MGDGLVMILFGVLILIKFWCSLDVGDCTLDLWIDLVVLTFEVVCSSLHILGVFSVSLFVVLLFCCLEYVVSLYCCV